MARFAPTDGDAASRIFVSGSADDDVSLLIGVAQNSTFISGRASFATSVFTQRQRVILSTEADVACCAAFDPASRTLLIGCTEQPLLQALRLGEDDATFRSGRAFQLDAVVSSLAIQSGAAAVQPLRVFCTHPAALVAYVLGAEGATHASGISKLTGGQLPSHSAFHDEARVLDSIAALAAEVRFAARRACASRSDVHHN